MPNAKQHMLIGASTSVAAWYFYCKIQDKPLLWEEFLLAGVTGAAVGLLPDILEPATSPHHRQVFHSLAAAGLIAQTNRWAWQNPEFSQREKISISVASAAYVSHLLADSSTPMGIPIIGRIDL